MYQSEGGRNLILVKGFLIQKSLIFKPDSTYNFMHIAEGGLF